MSGKLTRAAYEQLIEEDIAWLGGCPPSLERTHVRDVLLASVDHEYPPDGSAHRLHPEEEVAHHEARVDSMVAEIRGPGAAERELGYQRAIANVVSILRLTRERGSTVHMTRGAGYEEILDEVDALVAMEAGAITKMLRDMTRRAKDAEPPPDWRALEYAADMIERRYALKEPKR